MMDAQARATVSEIWNDYLATARNLDNNQGWFASLSEEEQDVIVGVQADRVDDLFKLGFTADHAIIASLNESDTIRSMVVFDFEQLPAFTRSLEVQLAVYNDASKLTIESLAGMVNTAMDMSGMNN